MIIYSSTCEWAHLICLSDSQPHLPPDPLAVCLASEADKLHWAQEVLLLDARQLHAQCLWLLLTLADSLK